MNQIATRMPAVDTINVHHMEVEDDALNHIVIRVRKVEPINV